LITAGSDYNVPGTTGSQFTVAVSAGVTTQAFPVTIIDDDFLEPDETFMFTITGISSSVATVGERSTTAVTIDDNDGNVASYVSVVIFSTL